VTALLSVGDLHVGYDAVSALRGVDLTVREGEIVAVLGANGAGKSTLLKTIAGLVAPRAGTIMFADRDITGLPAHDVSRQGISMLPEGRELFRDLSVLENLQLGFLPARRRPEHTLTRRIDYAFELFPRLRERSSQRASTLSGGEAQMLGIARALMCAPRLLVVDELSLGLAPQIVEQLFDVLATINAAGTSVIIVEQFVDMALRHSHRAYVLAKGEVVLEGPSAEVGANPDVVDSYLGAQRHGVAS
jgi:branched-chain amino acid transport system ATP-binding protein